MLKVFKTVFGLIKTSTNDCDRSTFVEIRIESIEEKAICVIEVKQKAPKSWTYVDLKIGRIRVRRKSAFL